MKRALFLSNLPADEQSILAGQDFSDIEKLAEAADRLWEVRCTSVQHITQDSGQPSATIESVKRHRAQMTRPVDTNTTSSSHVPSPPVCFYHLRFGPQARNCQPGCKFSSLLSKASGKDKASHSAWQQLTFSISQARFRLWIRNLDTPTWLTREKRYLYTLLLYKIDKLNILPLHSPQLTGLQSTHEANAVSRWRWVPRGIAPTSSTSQMSRDLS